MVQTPKPGQLLVVPSFLIPPPAFEVWGELCQGSLLLTPFDKAAPRPLSFSCLPPRFPLRARPSLQPSALRQEPGAGGCQEGAAL